MESDVKYMICRAAVKILDLRKKKELVIPCHGHTDAFYILEMLGYEIEKDYLILAQGFLNDRGYFLDRTEAYKDALACGQINKDTEFAPVLYSKDLWNSRPCETKGCEEYV